MFNFSILKIDCQLSNYDYEHVNILCILDKILYLLFTHVSINFYRIQNNIHKTKIMYHYLFIVLHIYMEHWRLLKIILGVHDSLILLEPG